MKDNDPWNVPEWTLGYVKRLFSQRGYNATEDAIIELIEGQWHNWKRLLLETGLCHDRQTAEDTAFKFSTHKVIGGAGRIFENFADYLQSKPQPVRELEENRTSVAGCELCENTGVIMAEVVNREGRIKNAAFGCHCEKGRTCFAGITQATAGVIENRKWQIANQNQNDRDYLQGLGFDPDKPLRFRDLFRSITKKPVKPAHVAVAEFRQHRSGNSSVKTNGSNAGNAGAVSGDSDIWAESDDQTALLVYQNGDERGWFE